MTILGVSNRNLGDIWWKFILIILMGIQYKSLGLQWNLVGLRQKSGSSNKNVGVFNENLGSTIKIWKCWVSHANLGSHTKIWESLTKIWESHTKIWEPYTKISESHTKISESQTKIWGLQFIVNAPFNVFLSFYYLDLRHWQGILDAEARVSLSGVVQRSTTVGLLSPLFRPTGIQSIFTGKAHIDFIRSGSFIWRTVLVLQCQPQFSQRMAVFEN